MERILPGGLINKEQIVLVAGTVRRPSHPNRRAQLALLAHLNEEGFPAPVWRGTDDDGRDMFDFIEGDVPLPPFPEWSLTAETLESVAVLLRRYHDAVTRYRIPAGGAWSGELADPRDGPIICHNDVCPENDSSDAARPR